MTESEAQPRFNEKLKKLPTPEQATEAYSEIARGVLVGAPAFKAMDEATKTKAIAYTAYMAAATLFKYGGNLVEKGVDAAWSSFSHQFSRRSEKDSIVVKFRQVLGFSDEGVYRTLYAMLIAGVTTKEALAAIRKPPQDLLEGLSAEWLDTDGTSKKNFSGRK